MMTLDRDAADNKPDGEEQQQPTNHMDISDADDRMKRYYGVFHIYAFAVKHSNYFYFHL